MTWRTFHRRHGVFRSDRSSKCFWNFWGEYQRNIHYRQVSRNHNTLWFLHGWRPMLVYPIEFEVFSLGSTTRRRVVLLRRSRRLFYEEKVKNPSTNRTAYLIFNSLQKYVKKWTYCLHLGRYHFNEMKKGYGIHVFRLHFKNHTSKLQNSKSCALLQFLLYGINNVLDLNAKSSSMWCGNLDNFIIQPCTTKRPVITAI